MNEFDYYYAEGEFNKNKKPRWRREFIAAVSQICFERGIDAYPKTDDNTKQLLGWLIAGDLNSVMDVVNFAVKDMGAEPPKCINPTIGPDIPELFDTSGVDFLSWAD